MTEPASPLARRHLKLGLWGLLLFLVLGLSLEAMHAFKIGWLLDVGNDARRLSLRLAHAHGALLGALHVLYGLLLTSPLSPKDPHARRASACLTAALVLMPGGFVLGGLFAKGGDPGPGALLVPVGAVLLILSIVFAIAGVRR
jgi:hypothetical protein